MSVTFGFYNALNDDRMYNAIQMSSIFDGIIYDGVYETIGEKMMVKESTGMNITVGTGRAWFNHTWTLNDAKYVITIDSSDQIVSRIDAICLTVNTALSERRNYFEVIQGQKAVNPVKPDVTSTTEVFRHVLGYVRVGAGVTEITQSAIENTVGTSECPFVTGPLQHMTIDDLIAQWQAEWGEWEDEQKIAWAEWFRIQREEVVAEHTAFTETITEFEVSAESDFNEWFQGIKDILDEDTAGHLQNEINSITDRVTTIEDNYDTDFAALQAQVNAMLSDANKAIEDMAKEVDDKISVLDKDFKDFKDDVEAELQTVGSLIIDSEGYIAIDYDRIKREEASNG